MFENDNMVIQCPQCGHTEFEGLSNEEEKENENEKTEDKLVVCCNCKLEILTSDLEDEGMLQAKKEMISETKEGVVKFFKNLVHGEKLT